MSQLQLKKPPTPFFFFLLHPGLLQSCSEPQSSDEHNSCHLPAQTQPRPSHAAFPLLPTLSFSLNQPLYNPFSVINGLIIADVVIPAMSSTMPHVLGDHRCPEGARGLGWARSARATSVSAVPWEDAASPSSLPALCACVYRRTCIRVPPCVYTHSSCSSAPCSSYYRHYQAEDDSPLPTQRRKRSRVSSWGGVSRCHG